MKKIAALVLSLTAVACGTQSSESDVKGFPGFNPRPQTERSLFALEGTITEVAVQAARGPAVGMWSNVTVEYMVPCSAQLETAALSSMHTAEGKTKILSAAYASTATKQGDLVCQAFSHETRTITLPGMVDKDSLELVNMAQEGFAIPDNTMKIVSSDDIKVTGTRALCPEGMTCIQGGTVVELQVKKNSCVDELGPVAYAADQSAEGGKLSTLKLAVNAQVFQSKKALVAFCSAEIHYEAAEIVLPMLFGDKDSIELQIVQ